MSRHTNSQSEQSNSVFSSIQYNPYGEEGVNDTLKTDVTLVQQRYNMRVTRNDPCGQKSAQICTSRLFECASVGENSRCLRALLHDRGDVRRVVFLLHSKKLLGKVTLLARVIFCPCKCTDWASPAWYTGVSRGQLSLSMRIIFSWKNRVQIFGCAVRKRLTTTVS